MHFDDDEDFTDGKKGGINLLRVATHEIGHVLGLTHSDQKTSVMSPIYKPGYDPNFKLSDDDIKGIQFMYGMVLLFDLLMTRICLISI